MAPASSDLGSSTSCAICKLPGSDLQMKGCSCLIHVKCIPLSFVSQRGVYDQGRCPACAADASAGMRMLPLHFQGLERAVELRKNKAQEEHGGVKKGKGSSLKRSRDENVRDEAEFQAFSQGRSILSASKNEDALRTGRWTEEEVKFTDCLVACFDNGLLPLPNGIKMNQFLGDMLLCKSSRLTKKMKNAKLSTRSFNRRPAMRRTKEQCAQLASQEEKFLAGLSSEITQIELRFNITKQWRSYFSNLCLQVGFKNLDQRDWMASIEVLEKRSTAAEERVKRIRRQNMGFALGSSSSSTATTTRRKPYRTMSQPAMAPVHENRPRRVSSAEYGQVHAFQEEVASMNEFSAFEKTQDPFSGIFSDTFLDSHGPDVVEESSHDSGENDVPAKDPSLLSKKKGRSFLDAIKRYMEGEQLPFQHADVWVPSSVQESAARGQVKLLHAGSVTRRDVRSSTVDSLEWFGENSQSFSFDIGKGLPGRIYASGVSTWELNIDTADPAWFARCHDAKKFGVKTAAAIPISSMGIGRMIVILYSTSHLPRQDDLLERCGRDLSKYAPAPKWKLVIDVGNDYEHVPSVMKTHQSASSLELSPHPSDTNLCQQAGPASAALEQAASNESPLELEEFPMTFADIGDDEEVPRTLSPLFGTSSTTNPLTATSNTPQNTELEIMSLLHSSSNTNPSFRDSLGELLGRHSSLRTSHENELLETIKSSFKAYASDNRRGETQIVQLLYNEWMCLKQQRGGGNMIMGQTQSMRARSVSMSNIPQHQLPPPTGGLSRPPPLPIYPARRASMPVMDGANRSVLVSDPMLSSAAAVIFQ